MTRYTEEVKAAIIQKMMPPRNVSVAELEKTTGVPNATLYTWRKQARAQGVPVPGNGKNAQKWSSETRLAVLMETAAMNQTELSEYCRKKGLHPEQIEQWKAGFIAADSQPAVARKSTAVAPESMVIALRNEKKRNQKLERALLRKDRALAEAAALLVLSKKAAAIWPAQEDV